MHELAICQALLAEVEHVARARGADAVAAVRIRCGALAGVEPELLARAYEVARAGTLAEDASLTIEHGPVRVHCPRCGCDSSAEAQRLVCASCGEWRTELLAGDELMLMSIDLITADGARP